MKIQLKNAAMLLLLIAGGLFNHSVFGQTNVSGALTSSTTWDLTGSPYTIIGDITVETGADLTIEPGVVVIFQNSARDLFVNSGASLTCDGTPTSRINLYSPDGFGGGSVVIRSGATVSLNYTDIDSLGQSTLSAFDCAVFVEDGASLTMDQCTTTNTIASIKGDADAFSNVGTNNSFSSGIFVNGSTVDLSGSWPMVDPAGVTYRLLADVTIDGGSTLTFGPGIVVEFFNSSRDLIVTSGAFLISEGTSSDRITLVSYDGFGGGSVLVESGGSASIKRTDIDGLASSTLSAHDGAIFVEDNATLLLANSTISNTLAAIRGDADAMSDISGNNSLDTAIRLTSNSLDKSATLRNADPSGTTFVMLGDLTVSSGTTLDIEPGVTVSMPSTVEDLIVADGGAIFINGTVAEPVTFIGTNGFGAGSIYVQSNGSATIDYVELINLGQSTLSAFDASIRLDADAFLSLDNSIISNTQSAIFGDADALSNLGANNTFDAPIRVYNNSLDGTTTWPNTDPSGTVYFLDADQTVAASESLTIESGVLIEFGSFFVDLVVDGDLIAIGTKDEPITFFCLDGFGGGSINFRNGGSGTLEHFAVDNLGSSSLSARDAAIAIDNADVDLFSGAITNSQRGVRLDNATDAVTINGVDFTGNDRGVHVLSMSSSPQLRYCDFDGNSPYGIDNDESIILDACHNYWGDAIGPYEATLNPTSTGDTIIGLIDAISCAADESALENCAAPVDLSNSLTLPDIISFNWTRVPVALGYRINAARNPDMVGFQSPTNSKSVPGVVAGDTVIWSVKAGCFFTPGVLDISSKSEEVTFVVTALKNAAPGATLAAINLYPNPAADVLTIELPAELSAKGAVLEVIDLRGSVVLTQRLSAGQQQQLAVDQLVSGNYFLQLHGNGKTFSSSFSIQ